MRICKDCKETKEEAKFRFHKRNTSTGGFYSTQCLQCISADKKEWVQLNWYKVNESNKRYNREHAHIIRGNKLAKYWQGTDWKQAIEKYDELLVAQNGVCALCSRKEERTHPTTGVIWDLAVDHNHETGEVRGLLCNSCNRGLGLLGDSPEAIEKALKYLKKAA